MLLIVVVHGLLTGHEHVEAGIGADGHVAVQNAFAALLSAYQLQVISELLWSIDPHRRLSFVAAALVLEQCNFLGNTVLDIANGEIGTLLDDSLQRTLLLFDTVHQVLREVVGQAVIPEVVDGVLVGVGFLDLVIVCQLNFNWGIQYHIHAIEAKRCRAMLYI